MTGQAARRGVVCVERFAHNLDDATAPDNDGVLRRALRISRAAPEWLEATAPVRTIARAIEEAGVPARMSRNAGAFVCNHLYFGALAISRRQEVGDPRRLCAFAGGARAGAAGRKRKAAHAARSGERASGGGRGHGELVESRSRRRDSRPLPWRRRRRYPFPGATARRGWKAAGGSDRRGGQYPCRFRSCGRGHAGGRRRGSEKGRAQRSRHRIDRHGPRACGVQGRE